ncbi:MAG: ABC transporter substrate-binding protein [Hyphomicrobiaceae bacterium]
MQRVRLSENFRAVFYAPFYATQALGYYASEGLDVVLIESSAPGNGPQGLLDGSVDVSWGGPMRVMKDRDEGGPGYMCFCEVVRRDPFYLVGRTGDAPFQLTDLATKRLGVVSEVPTPWHCLQHDLREAGLDPARLDLVRGRSMADNLAAVASRTLDVAQVFEPFTQQALAHGLQILYAQSARGPTSYTTLLGTRETVVRNREMYTAMTRAVARMQGWLVEHSAADLAEAVASFYPQIPRATLAAALAHYKAAGLWADGTVVSRTGFERLAVSLKSGGFIRTLPRYDDCVVDFSAT